jgi:hypothetical protein
MLKRASVGKKKRMSIAMKSRSLFLAVCVLSLRVCLAQTSVNFTFSGGTTPIYDFGGTLQIADVLQGTAGGPSLPISFEVPITEDGRGTLRGSDVPGVTNPLLLMVGSDPVAAHYKVLGRVSGGVNAARIKLVVRLFGDDVIAGVQTKFSIVITYDLSVVEGALQGKSRGSAKFSTLGSAIVRNTAVSIPLPAGMDGSWSLQLNFVPLKRLGGTGTITLSNGRTLPMRLSGSSALGRFVVRLTGINEGAGNRLNVIFFDGVAAPEVVLGRVLGQSVRQ